MKSSGAIAIEGPIFCGKTTTALRYAKSDIRLNTRQRIELARMQPENLLKGDTPRVIDEWQTVPDIWNEVKAWIDENPDFGQFILTGSSTPADKTDIYHSGAGRITTIGMKPTSLMESKESSCTVSLKELFENLKRKYLMRTKIPILNGQHSCFVVVDGRFRFVQETRSALTSPETITMAYSILSTVLMKSSETKSRMYLE